MHAEMDAAPQDDAVQSAIMERHWHDALSAGAVPADDHETRDTILSCLYHAAPCRDEVSAERMSLGMRLMSPRTPPPAEEPEDSADTLTPEETVAFLRAALGRKAEMARGDIEARAAFYGSLFVTAHEPPEDP
jgi:hypothetical protein